MISIVYSPVNQAWFVMWYSAVLSIFNSKLEAQEYASYLKGE